MNFNKHLVGLSAVALCMALGNTAQAATISAGGLESFLGLPANSLGALANESVTTGSATKQTFTAHAGDILSFDYKFMTNESAGGNADSNNDFAFVGISPLYTSVLADTFSPLNRSADAAFARETSFQHYSVMIQQTGSFSLNLGVLNADDGLLNSGLLIDNLNLSSGGISSPQFSAGDFEHGAPAGLQAMGDVGTTTEFPSVGSGSTQLLLNAGAVPEPTSLALAFCGGFSGLIVAVYRRRKAAAAT